MAVTPRRSHNRWFGKNAIELVSAWAQSNRLRLGQLKVEDDSNEITAVPKLLRLLQIKGCIVTVDAINTQKDTVNEIREQGAGGGAQRQPREVAAERLPSCVKRLSRVGQSTFLSMCTRESKRITGRSRRRRPRERCGG